MRARRWAISIYEAKLYVRGPVKSLGADCIEKPMRESTRRSSRLARQGRGANVDVAEFKRYGSARKLYHFHIDNAGAY